MENGGTVDEIGHLLQAGVVWAQFTVRWLNRSIGLRWVSLRGAPNRSPGKAGDFIRQHVFECIEGKPTS